MQKFCLWCEAPFETVQHQKFCCKEHQRAYKKASDRLERKYNPKTRVCKECGKQFPVVRYRLYCDECQALISERKNKEKKSLLPRQCVICGKEISTERKRNGAITCSDECYRIRKLDMVHMNYNRTKEEKKKAKTKPKPVFPKTDKSLEQRAAAQGLSYGQIQGYKYQGILEREVLRLENQLKGDHVYRSCIGGRGHGSKTM